MNRKHALNVHQGPPVTEQAVNHAIEQLIEWAVNVLDRECLTSRPGQDTYVPQGLIRKEAV